MAAFIACIATAGAAANGHRSSDSEYVLRDGVDDQEVGTVQLKSGNVLVSYGQCTNFWGKAIRNSKHQRCALRLEIFINGSTTPCDLRFGYLDELATSELSVDCRHAQPVASIKVVPHAVCQ